MLSCDCQDRCKFTLTTSEGRRRADVGSESDRRSGGGGGSPHKPVEMGSKAVNILERV